MRIARLIIIAAVLSAAVAARAEGEDDGRVRLDYRGRTLLADGITRSADGGVQAEGHVLLTLPAGSVTASRIDGNLKTTSGLLSDVAGAIRPFRAFSTLGAPNEATRDLRVSFTARTARYSPSSINLTDACVTTCTHERPHYHLAMRNVTFAGHRVEASGAGVYVGETRIATLPRIATSLGGVAAQSVRPMLVPGSSGIDGAYLEGRLNADLAGGGDTRLLASARTGSKGGWRGDASLVHAFDVARGARGTVALLGSRHADMGERVVGVDPVSGAKLARLVVSRHPVVAVETEPVPLGDRGYQLRVGASAGRYTEQPTDRTHDRAMGWGALSTPTLRLGHGAQAQAEVGLQAATYDTRNRHAVGVARIAVETDPTDPDHYMSVAYVRRAERGNSPFAFDRRQVRQELVTEAEFPLTARGDWRLNAWNRHDLEANRSRALNATLIYRLDCISYGISYNNVSKSLGVGFVINGFDSFRHGVETITFAP